MVELTARRLRTPAVRAALRSGEAARVAFGLTAFLLVGALGFANGGYFPVAWGWSGLALLLLAAAALVLRVRVEVGTLDRVFLGGLAALTLWIFASLAWTSSVPSTVLEVERMLVYLAAGIVGFLVLRRSSIIAVLVGIWAAITVVSAYGLATRLFPESLGSFD